MKGGGLKGVVTWYNTNLEKVRVLYEEDGSDDYIMPEEINGIDIILCV